MNTVVILGLVILASLLVAAFIYLFKSHDTVTIKLQLNREQQKLLDLVAEREGQPPKQVVEKILNDAYKASNAKRHEQG